MAKIKKEQIEQLHVDDLSPDQTGNAGKVLQTDGSTATWETPTAESQDLQDVTDLGATTTNTITLNPSGNNVGLIANGSGSGHAIDIDHAGGGTKLNIGTTGAGDLINAGTFSVDNAGNVTGNNLSGTNTGDQTSIAGITGTKAQFDTAVTDGDFMYVGDAPTAHTHTASEVTDFAATVRATVLTGLSLATNAVISATDTVLSALGKLQAQITANATKIATQDTDALVQTPTATEDGYAIKWNDTNQEYELGTAGGAFTDIDTDYGAETVSSAWDFTGDFSTQSITDDGAVKIQPTATADNPNYAMVSAQATTNLCVNPRFEVNHTDGWSDYGTVTRSRTTGHQKWGAASMQLTSSSANAGATMDAVSIDASSVYVFSFWAKGASGGERVQIRMTGDVSAATNNGDFAGYGIPDPVTTDWKRFSFWYATGASDTTLSANIYTNAATSQTIYVDGVQLEKLALADPNEDHFPTPYCDGAIGVGHSWSGTADNSSSSRTDGVHYLAPIGADSKGSMVQLQDGSFDGKMHFHSDWGFKGQAPTLGGTPLFPYIWTCDTETQVGHAGALEGLAMWENRGNGVAGYFKSGVTTAEGFVLDFGSLTSGAGMIVYAPSNLDTMISSGGVFFKFAGKSANSDMYKWGGDYFSAGDLGFAYDKRLTIYGGGGMSDTATSNYTGTVAYNASTTVTGTGTTFLTDYRVGDMIEIDKGGTWTVYTVASITSDTSLTTTTTVAATASGRNHRSRTRQYSPATIQLEGTHGNHQGGSGDYLYSLYPSGPDGQPRWMKSSAIEDTTLPAADADGSGIVVATADATTTNVNNTTTQTDLITYSSVAREFASEKNVLRIKFYGNFTGNATTTTFTYRLKVGGATLVTSPAQQVLTTNVTDYSAEITLHGPASTFWKGFIDVQGKERSSSTNNYTVFRYNASSTPDTTVDNDIVVSVQCSDASSSFAMNAYTIERL